MRAGLGERAGAIRKRDDHDRDAEQDQPLEMVVHRALQATGDACQLDLLVARAHGGLGPCLCVAGDGVERDLHILQQGREGEDVEFGGHGVLSGLPG